MAEKILIISPVPLFPGHAGNRERIRTICSELMDRGYILDFFYTGFYDRLEKSHAIFFSGEILQHNVKRERVSWLRNPIYRIKEIANGFKARGQQWLRRIADGPDSATFNKSLYDYKNSGKILLLKKQIENQSYKAVIVNYAPYSFYFDLFDDSIISIIDTHDQLTDRYKLYSDNEQSPLDWHSLRYEDEKRALVKADVVWAITEDEKRHFKKMVDTNQTKVVTLSHLMPFNKTESKKSGKNIILIGSGNRLNLEGLDWFIDQVWEKLKYYDHGIQFLIAGSICTVLEEYINDDRIQLFGLFDSSKEIYSMGEIFINPMQSGTGLKIKSFEALACGKFVVSTPAGATGLSELEGNGLAVSDEPSKWIREIISFFNDPDHKKTELKKAKKIISEIYEKNLETISKSLNE